MGLFSDLNNKLFPSNPADDENEYENEYYSQEEVPAAEERTHVRAQSDSTYNARNTANVSMVSGSSIEMKVVTPSRYDSVTDIANLLLTKKTVLLNLENTNKETARRLIDFLSGVAYALDGEVSKVAENTYAITPGQIVAVSKESVGQPQQTAQTEPAQNDGEINF